MWFIAGLTAPVLAVRRRARARADRRNGASSLPRARPQELEGAPDLLRVSTADTIFNLCGESVGQATLTAPGIEPGIVQLRVAGALRVDPAPHHVRCRPIAQGPANCSTDTLVRVRCRELAAAAPIPRSRLSPWCRPGRSAGTGPATVLR